MTGPERNGWSRSPASGCSPSVHAGGQGNVVKQEIGKPPAAGQPLVERCGAEEPAGRFAECRIPRGQEPERVDGRRQPEASDPKKRRKTVLKKNVQQVLRGGGFVAQILDLSQPVETIGFQTDAFMEAGRRRTLAEPLGGLVDQLRRDFIVIIENPSLAEERSQAGRIVDIIGDGVVLAVTNVHEPVCDTNQLLPVGRSLDQHDQIDVAVGGDGTPGTGPDEDDTYQIAAPFCADILECYGKGVFIPWRSNCGRSFDRFRNEIG